MGAWIDAGCRLAADKSGRLLLAFGLIGVLLVADWFFGSVTRQVLQGQATVSVTTEPSGATVIADTQVLGETPLAAGKLLPGRYVLRIEHPWYEHVREPVELSRGQTLSRNYVLEPGFGRLELVSNPRGAAVRLNGEAYAETTPTVISDLPAGEYAVELSIYGRKSLREQVEVLPDKTATVNGELNRVPMAALSVDVEPAHATIEIAGLPEAYSADMRLPLGEYSVQATAPGYISQAQSIRLRQGPNRLKFNLEQRLGRLEVAVTPASAAVSITAGGQTLRYSEALEVPIGSVRVSASRLGFRSRSKTIELTEAGAQVALSLPRFDVTIGRTFRDKLRSGGRGPEVVVVPAGKFRMGDLSGQGAADERPVHNVQLRRPFALGVREVSNAEWQQQFGADGDSRPATKMSREAVEQYLQWLTRETGNRYRLPTEAEWEFAARGGTESDHGPARQADELCRYANVADASMKQRFREWASVSCDDGYARIAPTGSFAPNAYGLYDMLGNVGEWVADCWHGNYKGAPADGRRWGSRCSSWVERGGGWDSAGNVARVSFRTPASQADSDRGFRVVRDL